MTDDAGAFNDRHLLMCVNQTSFGCKIKKKGTEDILQDLQVCIFVGNLLVRDFLQPTEHVFEDASNVENLPTPPRIVVPGIFEQSCLRSPWANQLTSL